MDQEPVEHGTSTIPQLVTCLIKHIKHLFLAGIGQRPPASWRHRLEGPAIRPSAPDPAALDPAAAARFARECDQWLAASYRRASSLEAAVARPAAPATPCVADSLPQILPRAEGPAVEPVAAAAGQVECADFPPLARPAPMTGTLRRAGGGKAKRRVRPTALAALPPAEPAVASALPGAAPPSLLVSAAGMGRFDQPSAGDGAAAQSQPEVASRLAARLGTPNTGGGSRTSFSQCGALIGGGTVHTIPAPEPLAAPLAVRPSPPKAEPAAAETSPVLRLAATASAEALFTASAEALFTASIGASAGSPRVQQLVLVTAGLICDGALPLLPPLLSAAKCLLMPPPRRLSHMAPGGEAADRELAGTDAEHAARLAIAAGTPDSAAAVPALTAAASSPGPVASLGTSQASSTLTDPHSDLHDACAYSALLLLRFSPALSRLSVALPLNLLGTAPRLAAAATAANQMGWPAATVEVLPKAMRQHLRAPVLPAGWAAEPVRGGWGGGGG